MIRYKIATSKILILTEILKASASKAPSPWRRAGGEVKTKAIILNAPHK